MTFGRRSRQKKVNSLNSPDGEQFFVFSLGYRLTIWRGSLPFKYANNMKLLRGPIVFSIFAGVMLAAFWPQTDPSQKEMVLMQTVLRGLERYHYSPQTIDDDFSQKVFDLYLQNIDGAKRLFTKAEIDRLNAYRNKLDDQALAGDFTFFNLSQELLDAGLKKTQGFYREILAQPFDFNAKEEVELDGEKRQWAANDAELRDYWRRYLKYEALTRYVEATQEQEKSTDANAEKKTPEQLENDARTKVLEMFDRWYDRLFKLKRDERLSQYINAVTGIYDPHTNYFKPIDKENFDIRFSGRLEGIGARLMTEGDYTKVSEVVVGGPAWKGKELEENDVLLKVAQGDEEPVDIKGMLIDDVVQLVRGPKGTEVRLTIKKGDGTVKVISIIRDVVIFDERFAKSLILDGANDGERIGYISLPSFYADFENQDGRNCAEDVAAELEKLKTAGVDGIILDLRNNGGGSLRDVVKMSGYFIERGPIVQVKGRNQDAEVLSDTDPRVQYDGPVVVLVNNYSASASEILAAALQDYGRAVIVGSNSTFGKGTVQRFIDLDRVVSPAFTDVRPLGEVKLTTQKFYRINGGSTQLRGVTPDIVLPDSYHYITSGEKEENHALSWTEIKPVSYNQSVLRLDHLTEVKRRSQERQHNSAIFQQIDANARRFERQNDFSKYPVALNEYKALQAGIEAEAKQFENMFDAVVNPGVYNLPADLAAFEGDESKKARNKDFVDTTGKDVYIREAMMIIHDIIDLERLASRN